MKNLVTKHFLKNTLLTDQTILTCGFCGVLLVSRSLYNKALGVNKLYHKVKWNWSYVQIYCKNTADNILVEKQVFEHLQHHKICTVMLLYGNTVHLVKYRRTWWAIPTSD